MNLLQKKADTREIINAEENKIQASTGTSPLEGPVLRRPIIRGVSRKPVNGAEMKMKAFQKVFMYLDIPPMLIRVLYLFL
jgi:hypothetical protein